MDRPSDYPILVAMPLTIAIDGPAASGKGTLSRQLAAHYGLPHLDTGLTYRAVAHAMLGAGDALDDVDAAVARAHALNLGALDRATLADHAIGDAASRVAVMPAVRAALVEAQRRFAAGEPGAVLDGRDIGTVVLPGATAKLYVTASPETRARRRHAEMTARGDAATLDAVLADLVRRDERDAGRADSPLRPAPDAHLLDTTGIGISTALERAREHVDAAIRTAGDAGPAAAVSA